MVPEAIAESGERFGVVPGMLDSSEWVPRR
jgi:hypothetical protein